MRAVGRFDERCEGESVGLAFQVSTLMIWKTGWKKRKSAEHGGSGGCVPEQRICRNRKYLEH